jgi:hypothetical protein
MSNKKRHSLSVLLPLLLLHCCCLQHAAQTAAGKMGAAADAVTGHAQFPEFPPEEGKMSTMHPKEAAAVSRTISGLH